MVTGLGMDLVEIARIERAMRNPRFLDRILTPAERAVCTTPARVAGRWAAKEAIAKALGADLRWHDVQILPGKRGEPVPNLEPALLGEARLRISITHERGYAAAVALLDRSR